MIENTDAAQGFLQGIGRQHRTDLEAAFNPLAVVRTSDTTLYCM